MLAQAGDRSIAQVAKDLDLTNTSLREWVIRAEWTRARALSSLDSRAAVAEIRDMVNLSARAGEDRWAVVQGERVIRRISPFPGEVK